MQEDLNKNGNNRGSGRTAGAWHREISRGHISTSQNFTFGRRPTGNNVMGLQIWSGAVAAKSFFSFLEIFSMTQGDSSSLGCNLVSPSNVRFLSTSTHWEGITTWPSDKSFCFSCNLWLLWFKNISSAHDTCISGHVLAFLWQLIWLLSSDPCFILQQNLLLPTESQLCPWRLVLSSALASRVAGVLG